MPIQVVGLNSRIASIEVRELFSFDAAGVEATLKELQAQYPNLEAVFVSTCNRTELYIASEKAALPEIEDVFPFLLAPKYRLSEPTPRFAQYAQNFYIFNEKEAIAHLFSVASSLDSMILGEPQILSQIKRAYDISTQIETAGPILNGAFQSAFKTAKRVSVETEIFKRRVSIPSVAVVDFALNIFERLNDKQTLVLGAGEMAEETLKYLADFGARSISVANRSREKAEKLAQTWNGVVIEWEQRMDAFMNADLVICATGASEPVVTLEQYRQIESHRKAGRPLFILDLAVPRNVDVSLSERPNVFLYSVDDLEAACSRNKELRDREIPKANKIVDEEAERFIINANARNSIETIKKLRDNWTQIKDAEVERLLHKIPCDPHTEEEIRYAFDRLVNKLLHSPTVSIRSASNNESEPKLVETIRRLFKL